ncbi:MAG TPA: beta-phosphoglucomutase family hydrolase [Gemmatimonadales bacterium]|jgi:beta-phosphoglucomutase|nr:beta-phosphoglucomutase family hydrolase [Gemmatimonadales bacterium]
MKPARMRAVLWDLDGTLIDSAEYHWQSWLRALEHEGFSLTREQFTASFGQRNDRILRAWLGPDARDEQIRRIGDAKEAAYRRLMREQGLEPLPGAREWVQRLAARGWRQAIASSAPYLNVAAVLDVLGWQDRFDALVSAEDVRRGKPDPDVFLLAAERLQVGPEACIVVEDAEAGVQAAHAAGMRAIGVGAATLTADLRTPSLAALDDDAFERLLNGTGLWQRSRPR